MVRFVTLNLKITSDFCLQLKQWQQSWEDINIWWSPLPLVWTHFLNEISAIEMCVGRCACPHFSIWNAKIIKHFSGMRKKFDRQIKMAIWNMTIGKCVLHCFFSSPLPTPLLPPMDSAALFSYFCMKFNARDWRNDFTMCLFLYFLFTFNA